jgi:hypothetical protein
MATPDERHAEMMAALQQIHDKIQGMSFSLGEMRYWMGYAVAQRERYCETCQGKGWIFRGSGSGAKTTCPSCGGDGVYNPQPNQF